MVTRPSRYDIVKKDKRENVFTYWQLYERAAKAKYGRNIHVIKTQINEGKVNNIAFELDASKHGEPREKSRTIIDINMKEYKNGGKEGQDGSVVKILKKTSVTKEDRYNFTTTTGVNFGLGGNIGAEIVGLAGGINASVNKSKTKTEEKETKTATANEYCYEQEEKICVPPGKCVKAKITTYSMKYETEYLVKFSIKKDATVPLLYSSSCMNLFCGCIRSSGSVLVRDMISTLTDYVEEDEDGKASFTQPGTLSWKGEGCIVDKLEEPLLTLAFI